MTLTPSGDLIITQAGAVVSGLNIQGSVYINAPNVTLIDCKVTSASFAVVQIADGVTGAVVQNCEINGVGSGNDGSLGINGQGTFIANNIYNVTDGINVTGSSLIKDNYIHDLQASGEPHYDGIQIDGGVSNVTISHNTVINSYDQTAAIMIDNYFGPISNISVDNNLLAGGGYTVYADAQFSGGPITGVSFTNNHMASGLWGYTDFNQTSPVYTGNINDGTALIATLNSPANDVPPAPAIEAWSPDTGVVGDGITDANKVTLTGTAAANSTVKVYDGTTQIGATLANAIGAWSLVTAVLNDATHILTATATNAAGLTSGASAVLSVTVDTIAPTAPVLVSDTIVNTDHVALAGTAEANSSIKVYDGTTAVGTATTSASGAWSLTTTALADGAHALSATATDVAGNVSTLSAPLDLVINVTTPPPVIASFSTDSGVLGDHITNDNTPTLAGTAVANSTIKVFDGTTQVGTTTANGSGQWTLTTPTLGDGSHSLTATDTDSSGHTSAASAALSVTIDTHPPVAPTMAVYAQDGSAVGGTTTLTDLILKGAAEANSTVKVFDGTTQIGSATANGTGAWNFDTGHLASGQHSFTSTDTDIAGNVGPASATQAVTVAASTGGGWPDLSNTGVPSGVTLTPSGDLIITQAGAVVSGLNIQGSVYINAPNVTLIDCKVTSANFVVVQIADGVTGAVVQNCEINGVGSGNDGCEGISGQGTFIGNNIYNVEDGISVTGPSLIKDNYIHDLKASGEPHYDGIEIDGGVSNVTISHNTVINSYDQTAAIMIDNYFGPISNISVDNNLLAGGGYTVYADAQFSGGPITGVSFTNNHMASGLWGYTDFNQTSPVYTGNVNDGTALIATLNSPANDVPPAPAIEAWSPDTGVVGDGITDANKVTLTGTAAANSTVKVYDGTTQIGATLANAIGAWSLVTAVLNDATHILTATATNAAGLTSGASAVLSVTVDTIAPTAPVLVSDTIVNTDHVALAGTAEANSSIKVYDGTTAVGTATTSASGAWSLTTTALADGAHALSATATDVAGNVSTLSAPLDLVINVTTPPPVIASFSTDSGVLGDHITNDNTPTLAGTAVANSTVKVFDGTTQVGTTTANGSGQWTLTTPTLGDGSHSLTATDTDSSGHTSAASAALSVTIDTHPPVAPTMAVYAQDGSAVGGTTTLTDLILKGAAEANSTVKVFDGTTQIGSATANGTGAWNFDTGHLASGQHSFTSTDTDIAGNIGPASATQAVAVIAPIEFTNLSENSGHIATIKGTADAYSQITVYEGSTSLGSVQAAANGAWSFATGPLSNVVHIFTAQEVNSAGQTIATSSGEAILGSTRGDTLTSTAGNDLFLGRAGADTFVFSANFGHDVIKDFAAGGGGHDTIQFSATVFDSFASVLSHASQVGHDIVIATGSDTLTLKNTNLASLNQHDFHFV
ncbi:hypothetical protein DB459_14680 [Bradyrhizobium sp. WD16]|nr:hypothetical protein DB459_14680 [Bradyrhizobium sp. WD16]